jgi:hypothetical protein
MADGPIVNIGELTVHSADHDLKSALCVPEQLTSSVPITSIGSFNPVVDVVGSGGHTPGSQVSDSGVRLGASLRSKLVASESR